MFLRSSELNVSTFQKCHILRICLPRTFPCKFPFAPRISILPIFHLPRYQSARVFPPPFETRGPLFSLPLVADGLFPSFSLFLSRSPSQLSRSRSSLSLGVVAPAFRRSRSLALKSLGPRVRTLDIAKVFQRSYNLSTCTLYAKHCAISSTVQRDTLRRVYIGKIRTGSWKFVLKIRGAFSGSTRVRVGENYRNVRTIIRCIDKLRYSVRLSLALAAAIHAVYQFFDECVSSDKCVVPRAYVFGSSSTFAISIAMVVSR